MADGDPGRRSRQMSFGRRTTGAVAGAGPAAATALAHRDEVVPDAFRPLSFVGSDGASHELVGDPTPGAPLPLSSHGLAIQTAIEEQQRSAILAVDALPEADLAPDGTPDGGAEGEALYRQFASLLSPRGTRRARARRAMKERAAAAGRAVRTGAQELNQRLGGARDRVVGGARRGADRVRSRVRNWLLRSEGVDEALPVQDFTLGPERAPLDRNGPWEVLDDRTLVHQRTQFGAAKSNVNRVDRVWYGDPSSSSPTEWGFFKPEPDDTLEAPASEAAVFQQTGVRRYRLAARAVMSSAVDRALGTDVLSRERFAEHVNWKTGQLETGNLSSPVGGRPLKGSGGVDAAITAQSGIPTVVDVFATDVPLRSPVVQKGMSDLQVVDWITGQLDRHGGNIFIDDAGVVKGIDNDLAFSPDTDVTGRGKNVGMPPVVHEDTARAVLDLSPERLEEILNGSVPPSERLTTDADLPARSFYASEMSAAKARLVALQDHLRKEGVVVSRFDDATYDRMRAVAPAPVNGRPARDPAPISYLDDHAQIVERLVKEGPHTSAKQEVQYPDEERERRAKEQADREAAEGVQRPAPGRKQQEAAAARAKERAEAKARRVRFIQHHEKADDPAADLSSWARGARSTDPTPPRDDAGEPPADRAVAPSTAAAAPGGDDPDRRPDDDDDETDDAYDEVGDEDEEGDTFEADDDASGGERSGAAETRGDEDRLGRRGEAERGRKSSYGRFVRAFGRDQEGSRASFQQYWDRVAQERAASAAAAEASRGISVSDQVGAQIAAELQRSYDDLPPLGASGGALPGDAAAAPPGAAPEGAAPPVDTAPAPTDGAAPLAPAGEAPARGPSRGRRFVRVASHNWTLARQLAAWLGAGFFALLQKLRRPGRDGEADVGDASAEPESSGPFRDDQLSAGDGWTVLDGSSVVTHTPPGDETRTNVNRVDKIVFARPIPGSDATLGFFKPEVKVVGSHHARTYDKTPGSPARLAGRAVLSSALDQALGTKVLAIETFGRFKNPTTGVWETGNVSAAVPGRALQGNVHDDPSKPIQPGGLHVGNVIKELNNAVDLRSPAVQKGLTDLQAIDWLSAQTDRHGGNIFVTDDGRVHGIDNDFSFGAGTHAFPGPDAPVKATIANQNVGMPTVLGKDTADAVLAMTPEKLQATLDGAVPPGERLGPNEMAAAKSRLEQLQQAIRDGKVDVVTSFDSATYDKLRTETKTGWGKPQATSYLDVHATLVEAAASGALAGGENLDKEDDQFVKVFTVNEDPNVDVGALAPSSAKKDVLEVPASPYDAALEGAPVDDATFNQPASDVMPALESALESAAQESAASGGETGSSALDASSMPVIDGSLPANDTAASAAAIGGVSAGVEGNVRRGRSASDSQVGGSTDRAARSGYALKRRSHAGSAPRVDGKKTPASGTKDQRSMPVTRTKRKKG